MIGISLFLGFLLLVGSVYDWKKQSLPMWILMLGGMAGLVGALFALFGGQRSLFEVGLGLLPGGMALLISYVTREQIGYGDGAVLLCMGGCMETAEVVVALAVALLGAFVTSIILLVFKRAGRNSRIPFVPFLCAGCFAVILGG